MATATFRFRGGLGPDFDAVLTFTGTSSLLVNTTTVTNVLGKDIGGNTIGPAGGWVPAAESGTAIVRQKQEVISAITSQPVCEYITWRSENNTTTHPTTGYSLDIWYDQTTTSPPIQQTLLQIRNDVPTTGAWLYLARFGGGTDQAVPLSANYWTVLYDYNNQYAIGWKKGGTCTLTMT